MLLPKRWMKSVVAGWLGVKFYNQNVTEADSVPWCHMLMWCVQPPPTTPPPRQLLDFFLQVTLLDFFCLHSFIHVFDLVCIKRIVCVSANVISVRVFCLFKIQHSNDFKVESFLYLLELSSFTDSSNWTSHPQECDLIVKPQPWVWVCSGCVWINTTAVCRMLLSHPLHWGY